MTPLGKQQKRILSLLSEGGIISGPEIAQQIGVPHHVFQPYVNRLRDRGYRIEVVHGYRLVP